MNNARDWIAYLQAFAPSFAVLVAIGVAVMQAYLQRQHLKHDLYNNGSGSLVRFNRSCMIPKQLQTPKTFYPPTKRNCRTFIPVRSRD